MWSQAHMGRLALPISDYITDTKTALDNSLRLLQAMCDLAAYAGWLTTALSIMALVQSLMQARPAGVCTEVISSNTVLGPRDRQGVSSWRLCPSCTFLRQAQAHQLLVFGLVAKAGNWSDEGGPACRGTLAVGLSAYC